MFKRPPQLKTGITVNRQITLANKYAANKAQMGELLLTFIFLLFQWDFIHPFQQVKIAF